MPFWIHLTEILGIKKYINQKINKISQSDHIWATDQESKGKQHLTTRHGIFE